MDQDIVATPPPPALTFTATRGAFLKLLLVNALLTILTLGIYRFWAKTKVRRYLWSHIRFLDDPLEYTGTAGELFLGFLIVLAVLFPLGFVYTTIQTLVPPDSGWVHVALEVLYYLVLFALIQIGFYRAWRYRMSRTLWRGIRFGLDGSSWEYLKLASGWTLLTVITLGVAYPWMQVELWRYQMRHTHIGSETFSFDGKGRDLLKPWLVVTLPLYFCAIGVLLHWHWGFGLFDSLDGTALELSTTVNSLGVPGFHAFLLSWFSIILLAALGIAAFFWFGLVATRYKLSHTRIGRSTSQSKLPIWLLARSALFAVLITIGIVFIGTLIVGIIAAFLIPSQNAVFDVGGVFGALFGLLSAVVVFPLIWAVVYQFELLKQLVLTTAITNPEYLEAVAQRPASDMKTGEGLADALDIGGL